ncbi:decaprenylphospho-beta-D-ribofuranose 2-oxidase [Pedococcus cremeus]|uniref:Decaprenylphospho-beta-D-ribofuranose 2-oxidase n=1 Tax=Pedococcus cremeus TaxID=587636 RepID=A0A1H9X1H4_9MICO|nr:FAD-binding oxidoreductase [Pedococcus cremeus]SES39944.1 decaprenylphospho-beta-D-ribofuranose 2-oxidase [Pedococcus cremeus]
MTGVESTLLTGWGRATASLAEVSHEASVEEIAETVRSARGTPRGRGVLSRGLGRSYGDAAQNGGGRVIRTDALTGIGVIDASGQVDVGAGASIGDVLAYAVPRGWFVPVTPGTRHVTLGGAVAADVHGKNHHRDGSIGSHVVELDLVDGRGQLQTLRPTSPGFGAVVGGMGLSGVVTRVRLRLRPIETASLTVHTRRTADLDETMAALVAADQEHRYTVAWLDTLSSGASFGRGVLTSGDHSTVGSSPGGEPTPLHDFTTGRVLPGPPWAPPALLTRRRMRMFNEAYYRAAPSRATLSQESVAAFFHPLDVISGWNRIYGRTGFLQYQFAVADDSCVRHVIEMFQRAGVPGFLAVLKRFGPGTEGAPLSFPRPGWTLALDMPALPGVRDVLDAADDYLVARGGRLYLAKDSRVKPELIPAMYPDLDRWRELRDQLDPDHVFASDLARRLTLC